MSPLNSAHFAFASLMLAVVAPRASADETIPAATEPSTAAPSTTAPAPTTSVTPAASGVAGSSSTTPKAPSSSPDWQLGIAVPALFATATVVGSAGVERRLTDNAWLLVDMLGAVQRTDDTGADGGAQVDDVIVGGVDVGARYYLVGDGRVRPSLYARAGLGASHSVVAVASGAEERQETSWNAHAAAGVDVDVFLVDNVAFRLGTSLLGARVQWGERTVAGATSPTPTFASAQLQLQPAAALQVFF